MDLQILNDGNIVWIHLNHSTKGAILEQFFYDSDAKTLDQTATNESNGLSKVKPSSYLLTKAGGKVHDIEAYYIDESDKFLYSLKSDDNGGEYKTEKVFLSEICAGASVNREDEYAAMASSGSLMAVLQKDLKEVTVCDLATEKMTA